MTTMTTIEPKPMTTDEPLLLTETDGHVAIIRINRPKVLNALNPELMKMIPPGQAKAFWSGLSTTTKAYGISGRREFLATDIPTRFTYFCKAELLTGIPYLPKPSSARLSPMVRSEL